MIKKKEERKKKNNRERLAPQRDVAGPPRRQDRCEAQRAGCRGGPRTPKREKRRRSFVFIPLSIGVRGFPASCSAASADPAALGAPIMPHYGAERSLFIFLSFFFDFFYPVCLIFNQRTVLMAAVHNHPQVACCHGHEHRHESVSDRVLYILEKVTAVALAVFCAYACMELFLPFFLVGMAVGLYQHISAQGQLEGPTGAASCSQGFLEQLTGVRLPRLVSLIANVGVTWCHIDHHTTIFVPVVAVSVGAWVGQATGRLGSSCA
jgi:hypothetical protein